MTSSLIFKKYMKLLKKNEGPKRRKMQGKTVKRNEKSKFLL